MRAFLAACLGIVLIAGLAFVGTSLVQRDASVAFTTEGARI